MFCSKCGNPIEKDALFCGKCGTPVAQMTAQEPEKPAEPAKTAGQPETPPAGAQQAAPAMAQAPPVMRAPKAKKSKKPVNKKALWIGLGAGALVIAAVLVVLFVVILPGGDGGQSDCLVDIIVFDNNETVIVTLANQDLSAGEVEMEAGRKDGGMAIILDFDDLISDPVDIDIEQRDQAGEILSRSTLEGLMVIDTEMEEDVDWKDYRECKTLYVSDGAGVIDLKDIAELSSVTTLYLDKCPEIEDLDDLESMPQLETLYVKSLYTEDLGGIGTLPRLKTLVLESALEDADFLEGMTSLQTLWLSMPNLEDIDVLTGLRGLKDLRLNAYAGDLDALEEMTWLTSLGLISVAQLEDLDLLAGMKGLTSLRIDNTRELEDIDALEQLGALKALQLGYMPVSDIDVLGSLKNLETLRIIYLDKCDDFSALEDMTGVRMLTLINVAPGDLDFLEGMAALEYVYLSDVDVDDEDDAMDILDELDDRRVEIDGGSPPFAAAEDTVAAAEDTAVAAAEDTAVDETESVVTEEPEPMAWNIVVSVPTLNSEFYQLLANTISEAIGSEYPQAEILVQGFEYDAAAQAEKLELAWMSGEADAVIIAPNNIELLVPVIQQMQGSGVPVVLLNTQPEDANGTPTVYYDFVNDGTWAAHMMLERMEMMGVEPEGSVAILTGMAGLNVLDMRNEAFISAIEQNAPGIEIVEIVDVQFDIETATSATENFLAVYPDLIGIFADMGTCGQGAAEALVAVNMTDAVTLVTFDVSSAMVGYVRDGTIDAIIGTNIVELGEVSAQILIDMMEGKNVDMETMLQPLVVTWESVDDVAEMMGY